MENQTNSINKTDKTNLKKQSIILLVFLVLITFGIYGAIWYLKRKTEFDNLKTQKKLSKGLIITYLIFIIISTIYRIIEFFLGDTLDNFPIMIGMTMGIALFIISLIIAFSMRSILNDLWESKGIKRKVSGLFTFFFNLFYLQYEINRTIDNKENKERTGLWIFFIIFILLSFILPFLISFLIVLFKGLV